jgi:hypothetical protein
MESNEFFEMVESLRYKKDTKNEIKIDNELVVANLLAGIATELRKLNQTLDRGLYVRKLE